MVVKRKMRGYVSTNIIVCDSCGKQIGKKMIRVSVVKKVKGLRDANQWEKVTLNHYHPSCNITKRED